MNNHPPQAGDSHAEDTRTDAGRRDTARDATEHGTTPDHDMPQAVEQHSRWPGWIWAVPIAALGIVGYLTFQQLSQRGPRVTVTFPVAGGIKADDTKVQYEGIEVGTVESLTFQKNLKKVDVDLRLNPDMAGHLGPGTRFWIEGRQPNLRNLSSLKSVISGPHIGIEPHTGDAQDHYDGLAQRPVNANNPHGTHFVLRTGSLGTISRGSSVVYRDMEVGRVQDTQLEPDERHFHVDVFIDDPYDQLVHQGSRFWDASAVQLSMTGSGPKLQFRSLPALLEGAVGFETPDNVPGGRAKPDSQFTLYDSRAAAENAPSGQAVRYRVTFRAADAGGLKPGSAITLDDKRIGTVVDSRLQYDENTKDLETTSTLALQPQDIALAGGQAWAADARPQMDALLRQLIGQGLRARLGSTIPLVGGKTVELAFVPGAAPASLVDGDPPMIPSGPGSDIAGLMSTINTVAEKINAMPLDQIGAEVHDAAQHIAAITSAPEITDSLGRLDRALGNIDRLTQQATGQVGPILAEVHRAADEAQSAMEAARRVIGANSLTPSRPGTAGLGQTLYEVERAARSLRELADYLDRHPEALLHGK